MKSMNFLPQWYKKKEYRSKKKMLMFITVILVICNGILITIDLSLQRQLKELEYTIKKNTSLIVSSTIEKKRIIKNISFFDDFKKVSSMTKDTVIINSAEINEGDIKVSALADKLVNYVEFIDSVEQSTSFRIKDISPPIESEGKIKFTAILSRK